MFKRRYVSTSLLGTSGDNAPQTNETALEAEEKWFSVLSVCTGVASAGGRGAHNLSWGASLRHAPVDVVATLQQQCASLHAIGCGRNPVTGG